MITPVPQVFGQVFAIGQRAGLVPSCYRHEIPAFEVACFDVLAGSEE